MIGAISDRNHVATIARCNTLIAGLVTAADVTIVLHLPLTMICVALRFRKVFRILRDQMLLFGRRCAGDRRPGEHI